MAAQRADLIAARRAAEDGGRPNLKDPSDQREPDDHPGESDPLMPHRFLEVQASRFVQSSGIDASKRTAAGAVDLEDMTD